MSVSSLVDYYTRRASEYERIYHKPERQKALSSLAEQLRSLLAGHSVLELACGTGYWSAAIAEAASFIMATDASEAVLEIARAKQLSSSRVKFQLGDAWNPAPGAFTAGLAAFWWSHVAKERIPAFLAGFHRALEPNARVVFADNRYVAGNSTPIHRIDEAGNSYQLRRLENGHEDEILKNFPSRAELLSWVEPHAESAEVTESDYFWCLSYTLKANDPANAQRPGAASPFHCQPG